MSEEKFYAGIGSRETPSSAEHDIMIVAGRLGTAGYTLRSGGAPGADSMFERHAWHTGQQPEIFLPWHGFNGSHSLNYWPSDEAVAMAERFHPAWHKCSRGARLLHARNCHQVLGQFLDEPVEFVVYWARKPGGTDQALRIAKHHGIPTYNLFKMSAEEVLAKVLGT